MRRLLTALVLLLATSACQASAQERSPTLDRCVHAGPHTRIIRFRSPGGHRTAAAILGVGKTGVVLSNQSGNYLCTWLPFARRLAARGIRALVYNYRWRTESAEATAAARALRERGVSRVVLVGASLGAGASLIAASGRPRGVVGVISLSGESFIAGVPKAVRRLTLPVLFVAAENDDYGAGMDARDFYAQARSTDKRLLVVPGNAHGTALLGNTSIRDTVIDWLVVHLRP